MRPKFVLVSYSFMAGLCTSSILDYMGRDPVPWFTFFPIMILFCCIFGNIIAWRMC